MWHAAQCSRQVQLDPKTKRSKLSSSENKVGRVRLHILLKVSHMTKVLRVRRGGRLESISGAAIVTIVLSVSVTLRGVVLLLLWVCSRRGMMMPMVMSLEVSVMAVC